jgi:hypothetical protein
MDETQETLRTSAFPSNHVKVLPWYIFSWTYNDMQIWLFCAFSKVFICMSEPNLGTKIYRKNGRKTCTSPQSAMGEPRADSGQLYPSSRVKSP